MPNIRVYLAPQNTLISVFPYNYSLSWKGPHGAINMHKLTERERGRGREREIKGERGRGIRGGERDLSRRWREMVFQSDGERCVKERRMYFIYVGRETEEDIRVWFCFEYDLVILRI